MWRDVHVDVRMCVYSLRLVDASKKALVKLLGKKKKSVVVYIGGIAELFLSSPTEEKIMTRKGFIKLALSQGADVGPWIRIRTRACTHARTHTYDFHPCDYHMYAFACVGACASVSVSQSPSTSSETQRCWR